MKEVNMEDFPLVSKGEIREAERRIAEEIFARYNTQQFTLVAVLEGSLRFAQEVYKHLIGMGSRVMFSTIVAKSYVGEDRQERMLIGDPPSWHLLNKRPVVVLDDILDSGRTLTMVGTFLTRRYGVKTIEMGALLVKKVPEWVNRDYVGFKLAEDAGFVVGYGLDYKGKYRDEDIVRLLREEEREQEGEETVQRTEGAESGGGAEAPAVTLV